MGNNKSVQAVSNERRRFNRLPFRILVRVEFLKQRFFLLNYTRDFSVGGFYLPCYQAVPEGVECKFEAFIKEDEVHIKGVGKVVWNDKDEDGSIKGIGIEIVEIKGDGRRILEDLIAVYEKNGVEGVTQYFQDKEEIKSSDTDETLINVAKDETTDTLVIEEGEVVSINTSGKDSSEVNKVSGTFLFFALLFSLFVVFIGFVYLNFFNSRVSLSSAQSNSKMLHEVVDNEEVTVEWKIWPDNNGMVISLSGDKSIRNRLVFVDSADDFFIKFKVLNVNPNLVKQGEFSTTREYANVVKKVVVTKELHQGNGDVYDLVINLELGSEQVVVEKVESGDEEGKVLNIYIRGRER